MLHPNGKFVLCLLSCSSRMESNSTKLLVPTRMSLRRSATSTPAPLLVALLEDYVSARRCLQCPSRHSYPMRVWLLDWACLNLLTVWLRLYIWLFCKPSTFTTYSFFHNGFPHLFLLWPMLSCEYDECLLRLVHAEKHLSEYFVRMSVMPYPKYFDRLNCSRVVPYTMCMISEISSDTVLTAWSWLCLY